MESERSAVYWSVRSCDLSISINLGTLSLSFSCSQDQPELNLDFTGLGLSQSFDPYGQMVYRAPCRVCEGQSDNWLLLLSQKKLPNQNSFGKAVLYIYMVIEMGFLIISSWVKSSRRLIQQRKLSAIGWAWWKDPEPCRCSFLTERTCYTYLRVACLRIFWPQF